MGIVFWASLFALYYIYDGYLRLLLVLHRLFVSSKVDLGAQCGDLPKITVLLTVYNEEDIIEDRIRNILQSELPGDKLELIVASDGSTDSTDDLVKNFSDQGVILFRPKERKGKTDTQNQAIQQATGIIVVFTDAGTSFDKRFLRNVVKPFSDPMVGGVDGRCLIVKDTDSGISESHDFYWRYELRLRQLESRLGILAVSSGACLAIRRDLFRPMEAIYGEDCIVPLDIVVQGYKMRHASDAIAYDSWAAETGSEFRTRVRMTLRNWQGTWSRPSLLNPLRHPGIALALWSHKLLRWLSPIFLMGITVSSTVLAYRGQAFFQFVSIGLVLACLAGIIGCWLEAKGRRLPVISKIYSFLLANAGFFVGIWQSVCGHRVQAYRN